MENAPDIKTAVVCMVYNGYEYLAEFLLYHLNLCDHIFLIDHNSQRDLRGLDMARVTCVRSNHEAQFQSECTNLVIEHFNIKKNYDWLFVLDIDEFLPFSNKDSFHEFLNKYKGENAVQFQWRNGVPFYDETKEPPPSLIDCDSIRFFHKQSPHCKTCVNIRKTKGKFVVPTGAHHIAIDYSGSMKPLFLQRKKRFLAPISDLPLFHIVAYNKDAFIEKIKIYVEQMKYREHVGGQGGGVVRDYPDELSNDEWLWYIANFRVSEPEQYYECKAEYFIEEPIFLHLVKEQVMAIRDKIFSCRTIEKQSALPEEKEYLRYKKDDREIVQNLEWFDVSTEAEIITHIPVAYEGKGAL
jgi:hypothetical protein